MIVFTAVNQDSSLTTPSLLTSTSMSADPIDTSTLQTITEVSLIFGFVLQLTGAVTNLINMYVFYRLGLSDVVSLSFFALSLSDFIYTLFNAFGTNCTLLISQANHGQPWAKDFDTFGNFFIWWIVVFKDNTLTITAYIAIVRCCIVVFPLRFKSLFTPFRTWAALVVIFLFMVATHMPMFFTQGLGWTYDKSTNTTRLTIWQGVTRKDTLAFHDMVNRNAVPYTCLFILAVCLVVLVSKLTSASKFRRGLAPSRMQISDSQSKTDSSKDKTNLKDRLSARDIRVVQAVCFISGLYIACFLPTALQSFIRLVVPEFNIGKRYNNSFFLVLSIVVNAARFNSSFNIVAYYLYNTKFKDILQEKCLPQRRFQETTSAVLLGVSD